MKSLKKILSSVIAIISISILNSAYAQDGNFDDLYLDGGSGGDPFIRFDRSNNAHKYIVGFSNRLDFYDGDNYSFEINQSAPANAVVIDDTGTTIKNEVKISKSGGKFISFNHPNAQSFGVSSLDSSAGLNNGGVGFSTDSSFYPLWVFDTAVSETLALRREGVGIGTYYSAAPLHVYADGNPFAEAKVLVENSSSLATVPRTLFELKNPGNTKFSVTNTDANESWSFANPGTGFRLSRQGSGSVELEIKNNGNAVLAGTLTQNSDINSKQDILPLDQHAILDKVMKLPITQWRYKDDLDSKHIGPMAQDFYQAFELGHTDKGISSIDTGGVALAAIQALKHENESIKSENVLLRQELNEVKKLIQQLVKY